MDPATAPTAPTAPTSTRAWRVEVYRRAGRDDPRGEAALRAAREFGLQRLRAARSARGYLLSPEYAAGSIREIAENVLADPVLEEFEIAPPLARPPRAAAASSSGGRIARVLVAPRPGVTDPVGHTLEGLLARTGRAPDGQTPVVGTYGVFEFEGEFDRTALDAFARRRLGNELIEVLLVDRDDLPFGAPALHGRRGRVDVALLAASDDELVRLSERGGLALSRPEMLVVQAHFRAQGREPTALELETIAQTWSEHCKHKTFSGRVDFDGEPIANLFHATIVRVTRELAREWCVSVFEDNAGIVAFDQGYDLCFKVETHNHPSAIDPYGGAGTGVGGVIRDVLGAGLGARPIANTDCFFVGPQDLPEAELPKGCLHPRRILSGVVAGVRDYGNCMGIPTVNGGVWIDRRYVGNPLVFCGTVGILPHELAHKEVRPLDAIVCVGGRTGRDGIHGATFSSLELHDESERLASSAVQIGNPIEERGVMDCLLAARDRRLYRSITDCGAGGFSSAVGEMARECGAEVELGGVPLKYPGLSSHEIWISEAQERMVLAVPPENLDALLALFASEDVGAHVLGRFTDTGRLVVRDGGEVVGDLDLEFLHTGLPRVTRRATWTAPVLPDPGCPPARDPRAALLALLRAPNIASKEWIVRRYDHEVQGRSVQKPLVGPRGSGPGDGAVLRPLASSSKGVAITCGANPGYGVLDPAAMAMAALDEALRNAVAVGGDPDHTAVLDNFAWGNCDKPDRLGSLVLAARGVAEAARAYGTPFISGKDSLNNEFRAGGETVAIPPTLLVSALSIVPDVSRSVSMDLKAAGNPVYAVGLTRAELGGSHYLALSGPDRASGRDPGGRVPRPDLAQAPQLLRALHAAIASGLVAACHDASEGGLAVAAAEMAFAGELGLELDLGAVPCEGLPAGYDPDATRAFSESCTRFLVEVRAGREAEFEALLAGLPSARVGRVTGSAELLVRAIAGSTWLRAGLDELRAAHAGAWPEAGS